GVSTSAVVLVLAITCLCLGVCWLGYCGKPSPRILRFVAYSLRGARLFYCGGLFVACGLFFNYLLTGAEVEFSEIGGRTGVGTIYLFFVQLVFPGFAIFLLLMLRRPTFVNIVTFLISSIIPLESILIGRREPAAMFALTVGMGLFFWKKIIPPRWLIG